VAFSQIFDLMAKPFRHLSHNAHQEPAPPSPPSSIPFRHLSHSGYDKLSQTSSINQTTNQETAPPTAPPGALTKSLVYAGVDGILTTLAIVTGAYGGNLSAAYVLVLGISNGIADALNMGLGDTISGLAEANHLQKERATFIEEVKLHPAIEQDELKSIYEHKGMTSKMDRDAVVDMLFTNQNLFVDILMMEELGMQTSSLTTCSAARDGFVTFIAFLAFGFVPLAPYCSFPFIFSGTVGDWHMFWASCASTAFALFVLGAMKSVFSNKSPLRTGAEMLAQGIVIGIVAYGVGALASVVMMQLS